MKDILKKATEENMPDGLLERTMQRLEPEMASRATRESETTSPWHSWLKFGLPTMALAGAAAAVVIVVRTNSGSMAPENLANAGRASLELLEDSEVIADLELLRNIEVLERLEESETWRTIETKTRI